jgi:4-hydroxy-3-methylbut-2-en-1-yl diphosphate synthase IspG/GcpE
MTESSNNIKYTLEKQWSFEVSSNACKEMYQNKWNKPAILPLTSDIKLFRDYIISVEKKVYNTLKINPVNMSAFKEFQENILILLVLLNRRRAGEVQPGGYHSIGRI